MGINFLKFPVTPAIVAAYQPIEPGLFDLNDDPDTFVLFVLPDSYSPILTDLGPRQAVYGLTTTLVQDPVEKRGIEVETPDSRPVIGQVLNDLRANAINDGTNQITVLDYVSPELGDTFTTRSLWLERKVTPQSGAFSADGKLWHTGGYVLRFLQL